MTPLAIILTSSIFTFVLSVLLFLVYLILPRIYPKIRLRLHLASSKAARKRRKEPEKQKQQQAKLTMFHQVEKDLIMLQAPFTASELLMVIAAVNVVILLLALFIDLIIVLLFFLIGNMAPLLLLNVFKARRKQLMLAYLPDVLLLISNSLKSGYSIIQAFDLISKEKFGPLSLEFHKLVQALRYGEPFDKAFDDLGRSIDLREFTTVVDTIIIVRETGGNMTQVIDGLIDLIRENQRLLGEIKAITAQGRISAWIIGSLPTVLFFMLYIINRDYMMTLFESSIGILLIAMSVMSQFIGVVIMHKIINIKVR